MGKSDNGIGQTEWRAGLEEEILGGIFNIKNEKAIRKPPYCGVFLIYMVSPELLYV